MTTVRNMIVLIMINTVSCVVLTNVAEAGLLYHAAKRGVGNRITTSGFSKKAMNPNARFGKGPYFGNSAKTALKERPKAGSLAVFRKSEHFNRKILDTRKLPFKKLERLGRLRDGRGAVKKGIIGPKLGHRLGNYASRNNKIIAYNSVKALGGTNYFIPKNMYNPKGRLIRPVRSIDVR